MFNQRLWTVLQVELSDPDNPLPAGLRTNLLKLSRYVDQRVFALASGGELRDLEMLSRINQEIAAGLMSGEAAPPAATPSGSELGAASELDLSV
jgi:flagellar protein FlaF